MAKDLDEMPEIELDEIVKPGPTREDADAIELDLTAPSRPAPAPNFTRHAAFDDEAIDLGIELNPDTAGAQFARDTTPFTAADFSNLASPDESSEEGNVNLDELLADIETGLEADVGPTDENDGLPHVGDDPLSALDVELENDARPTVKSPGLPLELPGASEPANGPTAELHLNESDLDDNDDPEPNPAAGARDDELSFEAEHSPIADAPVSPFVLSPDDPEAPPLPLSSLEPPGRPKVPLDQLQPDPKTVETLKKLAGPSGDPASAREHLLAAFRGESYQKSKLPDSRDIAIGLGRYLVQHGHNPDAMVDMILSVLDE